MANEEAPEQTVRIVHRKDYRSRPVETLAQMRRFTPPRPAAVAVTLLGVIAMLAVVVAFVQVSGVLAEDALGSLTPSSHPAWVWVAVILAGLLSTAAFMLQSPPAGTGGILGDEEPATPSAPSRSRVPWVLATVFCAILLVAL